MATNYSGADPIPSSQANHTHDVIAGDGAPELEIEHVYFTQAVLKDGTTFNHVVTGTITLKNDSKLVKLKNVAVYIQLDNGAAVHKPVFCDQTGTNLMKSSMTMNFPDIDPGTNSPTQPYYWTLKHQQGLNEPNNFTVTPMMTPEYTVSYSAAPPFTQSDATTVDLS